LQRLTRLILFLLLLGTVGLTACGDEDKDDSNGNQGPNNRDVTFDNAPPVGFNVGDSAPAFSLPSVDGGEVALADYTGQKPVLLYFHMAVG